MHSKLSLIVTMSILLVLFSSCNSKSSNGKLLKVTPSTQNSQALTLPKSLIPFIANDQYGGRSFEADGKQYSLYGVEDDCWLSIGGTIPMINRYIEASKYVNANCIAIHIPWNLIEPEKDQYTFAVLKYYINQVKKAGFKAVAYFTSTDFAAGGMQFVPDYIVNDTATYSKIQGNKEYFREKPYNDQKYFPICPSDPDTLSREIKAYKEIMKFLKEEDTSHTVMAMQVGGEMNFYMALQDKYMSPNNLNNDIRCECADCQKAFKSGTGLDFMTKQYANYIKALIDVGALIYDIPTYTCSAPLDYFGGKWRYAEDSPVRKATVNRANYFVGPSIAPTESIEIYTHEMDHYKSENIPGNIIWSSGIDTGHGAPGNPQAAPANNFKHLEIAPWYNIFYYKSLGAIYWDHPIYSITSTKEGAPIREKLRAMWSPLKGLGGILPKYKSAPANITMWWSYAEVEKNSTIGDFEVNMKQNGDKNYGACISLSKKDLIFTASTFDSGETTFTISSTDTFNGYKFERGSFDDNLVWNKNGEFNVTKNGNSIIVVISGDNGDSSKSIFRIYK